MPFRFSACLTAPRPSHQPPAIVIFDCLHMTNALISQKSTKKPDSWSMLYVITLTPTYARHRVGSL